MSPGRYKCCSVNYYLVQVLFVLGTGSVVSRCGCNASHKLRRRINLTADWLDWRVCERHNLPGGMYHVPPLSSACVHSATLQLEHCYPPSRSCRPRPRGPGRGKERVSRSTSDDHRHGTFRLSFSTLPTEAPAGHWQRRRLGLSESRGPVPVTAVLPVRGPLTVAA